MGFYFITTKEVTVKKGNLNEIKELLRARKMKYVITNPRYPSQEVRAIWEKGQINIKNVDLKVVPREIYNTVEANWKMLDLRRLSTRAVSKRR